MAERLAVLADRRLLAAASAMAVAALLAYGLATAIIPNPVFGRQIPPEPFAIAIWLASAPLIGLVMATWLARPRTVALALGRTAAPTRSVAVGRDAGGSRTTVLGSAGGFAAFLAIGCPVCNKVALVLLGTTGALNVWAPLQPLVGAASLALLAVTLWWRLGYLARGGACRVA
jgi:hypothetical protein